MKTKIDTHQNVNSLQLARVGIEDAIKNLRQVSTFGQSDKFEDRDDITSQQQSLNQVSRTLYQAILRLES